MFKPFIQKGTTAMTNISYKTKSVKTEETTYPRLSILYKDLPKLPRTVDRSYYPQHPTIYVWTKWTTQPEIRQALIKARIDKFMSCYLADYFWRGRHFCYGTHSRMTHWKMSDHTIRRGFLVSFFANIMTPIAKKVFYDSPTKGWLPIWALNTDLKKITPEGIEKAGEQVVFK